MFLLLGMATMPIPIHCLVIVSMRRVLPKLFSFIAEVSLLSFSIQLPIPYFKKVKIIFKGNLSVVQTISFGHRPNH